MWANWEIAALIEWLKEHNRSLPLKQRVGFYGLDVYSLWESLEVLMEYLSENDPKAAGYAMDAIRCFEPFGEDEHRYARSQHRINASCQEQVINLLHEIRRKAPAFQHDPEEALNAEQNAEIAVNAERYYRNMMGFDVNTWNLRDTHMMDTLNRILAFYGEQAKAIVWAHNTHIGDARFTDMPASGDINVGQLVREQKGANDVVLVGFGSYEGSVIAGSSWGAKMKKMVVPQAREDSVEQRLHAEDANDRILIFDSSKAHEWYSEVLPHRAIGVVYNPASERYGNYVPTVLNSRYDAFVYLDRTHALHPLHLKPDGHKVPETFPFEY